MLNNIKFNPPFIWFTNIHFLKRLRVNKHHLLIFEVIFQIIVWLRNTIYLFFNISKFSNYRFDIVFKGFLINNFSLYELNIWKNNGVNSWKDLNSYIPNKTSKNYHDFHRKKSQNNYKKSLNLLRQKETLLAIAPKKWKYPYEIMNFKNAVSKPKKKWEDYLFKDGIILKPHCGFGGINVQHIYIKNDYIFRETLFNDNKISKSKYNDYNFRKLISDYLFSLNEKENLLITPYIKSQLKMPRCYKTPVVRVITSFDDTSFKGKIIIKSVWVEVPLEKKFIIFIDNNNVNLNFKSNHLSKDQSKRILEWKLFIKTKRDIFFNKCLKASIFMHSKLPPINQVAWDWIPSNPEPFLLEGNSDFNLLVPQVFHFRNST